MFSKFESNNNQTRKNDDLWVINVANKGIQDESRKMLKNVPLRYDSLVFEFTKVKQGRQYSDKIFILLAIVCYNHYGF